MRITITCLVSIISFLFPHHVFAQTRLIAITGNRENESLETDETLFELSLDDASFTQLQTLTHIPDSDAIGYNPLDGLIYHTSGAETYSNNPTSNGFTDNQYLETVNLETGEITPIFNSNPDEFGLSAPRPTWVMPETVRTEDQIGPEFRVRGENEYHALRSLTFSNEGYFLAADEHGIFKLTPDGESTFINQPLADPENPTSAIDAKALSFANINGEDRLFVGERETARIWELNPETAEIIGDPIDITYGFGPLKGVIALAQHPDTGDMYGVVSFQGDGGGNVARDLVTIDLETGEANEVGQLLFLQIASMAFVFDQQFIDGDINGDGLVDLTDFNILKANFGIQMATRSQGDLSGDGMVDLADFNDLKANFGNSAVVPEPNSLLLAALGLVSLAAGRLFLRRWRRT